METSHVVRIGGSATSSRAMFFGASIACELRHSYIRVEAIARTIATKLLAARELIVSGVSPYDGVKARTSRAVGQTRVATVEAAERNGRRLAPVHRGIGREQEPPFLERSPWLQKRVGRRPRRRVDGRRVVARPPKSAASFSALNEKEAGLRAGFFFLRSWCFRHRTSTNHCKIIP